MDTRHVLFKMYMPLLGNAALAHKKNNVLFTVTRFYLLMCNENDKVRKVLMIANMHSCCNALFKKIY